MLPGCPGKLCGDAGSCQAARASYVRCGVASILALDARLSDDDGSG